MEAQAFALEQAPRLSPQRAITDEDARSVPGADVANFMLS